jgi:hypothetical protein
VTIAIGILTVIVWPATIVWLMSILVSSIDNHLKVRHEVKIDTLVKQANSESALQIEELKAKVAKLQENVTVIQNGLQWKK